MNAAYIARSFWGPGARYRLLHGALGCHVRCLVCGCTQEYGCASGCGWARGGQVCTRCIGRPRRFEYVERPERGVVAIRLLAAARGR